MSIEKHNEIETETKIPSELRGMPNWVLWRYEERDGKKTKIPINANTGARASSTDSKTWITYEKAKAKQNGHNGVGFVFDGLGICGIDLDKCRDPQTGKINQQAKNIIHALNSYTEISPSETGVHILLKGKLPSGGNRKGPIEMYDKGRFFCTTGNHLEGTPTIIESRQDELDSLHKSIFNNGTRQQKATAKSSQPKPSLSISDDEILDKARNAANGTKFRQLYDDGNWKENYPSSSEADMALCGFLAAYCAGDRAVTRRFEPGDWRQNPPWQLLIGKAFSPATSHHL